MDGSGMLRGPQPLSKAISEVIALRGLAHSGGSLQIANAWRSVAGAIVGEAAVSGTRASTINRGVLQVSVQNSVLLGELVSFHKSPLLAALKEQHGNLKIREIKFRLATVASANGANGTITP